MKNKPVNRANIVANGRAAWQTGGRRGKRANGVANGQTAWQTGKRRGKRANGVANGQTAWQTGKRRGKRANDVANGQTSRQNRADTQVCPYARGYDDLNPKKKINIFKNPPEYP